MLNRAIWLFFILLRLYKVVDGLRQPIAGENANVRSGEWYTLRVTVQNTHFQVFFDNQSLFEADDTTLSDYPNNPAALKAIRAQAK